MGFQQKLAKGKQNEQINDYLNPFKTDALNNRYHYAVRTLAKTGNTNYEQIVNDAYEATRLYGQTVAQSVGAGVNDAMTNLQAAQTEMDKYLKLTGYGYNVQGKTEEEIGELYNRNVKAPRTNWMQNYMTTPYNGIEWEKQATDNAMTTKILADLPGYLTKMAAGHGLENGPDLSEEEIMHMSKLSYLLPADAKGVYRRLLNNHNYVIDDYDKNILENARKAISEQLGLPAEYIPFELDDYGAYIEDYYRKNTLMGAQEWYAAEPDSDEAYKNLWLLERKLEYDKISEAEDFVEKSKANQKELGVFRSNDEQKYAYINDLSNQRLLSGLEAGRSGTSDPFGKYYFMYPEEVGIYNYLHAQEDGQKKADEYLQYLEYDLNKRQNDHIAQMAYNAAGKDALNATIYSGASIMGSILRGGGYIDVLWQRLFGGDKPIDYERRAAEGVFTDAVRQGVMDSTDWKLNIGGKEYDAFDFLYSTSMSWADSAAAGAMFGPTGAGVALGLSAAESTFQSALDKSGDIDTALIASTFAGVFEGLFEKFSLGELQKAAKGARGQNFFKNLGWQGLVNASEELNTDLANMYIDNFILGDLSDYNLAVEEYKRLGMEPAEAEAKARQDIYLQLAETAIGGGLMGGGSAAISSTMSAANTAAGNKQAGNAITSHDANQVLKDIAIELGENTEAGKLGKKYDPKNATNRQTGRLYRAVINELPQQMRAPLNERIMMDIDQKLQELGETGDTAKIADAVRAMFAGENISEEQFQAIAQSENGLEVVKDLMGVNETETETETQTEEKKAEEDYPPWEDNADDANAQAAPAQEQNAPDQTQADLQDKYDKEVASHNQTKEDLNAMTTLQGETKAELDAKTEEYNQEAAKLAKANEDIQNLNNTISGMKKDLEDLNAKLEKQEELSEQELQKVQADKAAIESELAIAQTTLNGMTTERDELAGRVETLEGEKTALQDKYDKEVASHNQTKEALEAKTKEYSQALTDLETANKNIETLGNTISGMEKDLEDLKEQLEKQEELSEQELQKVQADKAAIESELAIAKTSLNGMITERDELAGRVATLEGEKTALQDKYDKEVASHNQTKEDLGTMTAKQGETQAALDKMTAKQEETQTALNKTEADLKVTKTALKRANSTVKANRIAIEATNKEIERLQDKLANQEALSEQERQEVQAEIDRLKSDLDIAETELATSEQEYADLKEKFNTLQTDKDNLERQLAGKQLEIKILRAQMGAVAKAFETTQSLLRTKNEELQATQDALDKANTTITENEASIKAATKEIETLQARLDSQEALSEQERQEAQAKIDELNADIDTYNTLLSQAQTDKTNLEGQIEILETAQAELEGQIATLNTDKANLEGQIATLQTDNTNLQAQNSSLQTDNANLQAQLDEQTAMTAAAEAEADALQKEIDALKKLIPDYRVGNDGEIVVNENGKAVPLEESSLSDDEKTIITAMGDADPAMTQAAVNAYSYLGSLFNQGKKQPAEVQQEATEQPTDEGMQDAKSFAKGFKRAVEWAKAGKDIMDSASPYVAELHEAVKKYAAQYGESLRQEELRKQEQENIQQAHDNGFQTLQENGEKVGVSFARVTKKVTEQVKTQLQLIDMFAKKYGLRVHVYDSLNDGKANGKFQKDTNLISVALDTEGGLLTRAASHESFHFIESWNKDAAKKLQDFVIKTLQGKEGYDLQKAIQDKIAEYAKNNVELTEQEATREIVADSLLDVIGTEENIRQLLKQDRTLVEKLSEGLKKIVADLKAMMQRLSGSSAEVKALQGDMDYYSNILQMVDEALTGAKENYAAAQYKSAAVMQDSAVQEYLSEMKGAVTKEDAQAALNGMVSNLFTRAEKGWLEKNPDVNLNESLQKFADALKSYQRGEAALSVALKRAGFDEQPYEMNAVLSYAGQQLLRAEARGRGSDVQYSPRRKGNANVKRQIIGLEEGAFMTNRQWGIFYGQISEIRQGFGKEFARANDGKFILAIDNKLIYTDGAWNNPTIESMVDIHLEDETDVDAVRLFIFESEKEGADFERCREVLEDVYFEGVVTRYDRKVFEESSRNTYKNRESEGKDFRRGNQRDRSEASSSGRSQDEVNTGYSFSFKKSDIAQSNVDISEDAELFAQVNMDKDAETALQMVQKLYAMTVGGKGYLGEETGRQQIEKGAWKTRLDELVQRLKDETGSTYSDRYIKKSLSNLFTAMDSGESLSDIIMYARDLGKRILYKAPGMIQEKSPEITEAVRILRESRFFLTDDMKSAIREKYGSLKAYQQKNFGRMGIRNKATSNQSGARVNLAEVWQELSDLMPGTFAADAVEADMPEIVDAFLDTAGKKDFGGEYGKNISAYATDLGLSMMLEYFSLPGAITKESQLRKQFAHQLQEMRTNERLKYEERIADRRKREEMQKAREGVIREISGDVKYLNARIVRESNSMHVPEEMKGAVIDAIKPFLNDTSVFDYKMLMKLREAYEAMMETGVNAETQAARSADGDILNAIKTMEKTIAGRRLSQLTLEELKSVRDVMGNLKKMVTEANEMLVNGKKEAADAIGNEGMVEMAGKKDVKMEKAQNLSYKNTIPIYFFRRIGGVFQRLYEDIREGQNTWAKNMRYAREFADAQAEKYRINEWLKGNETFRFTSERGEEIELSKGLALSIYCTWKREVTNTAQNANHLRMGGFKYPEGTKAYKGVDMRRAHALSSMDVMKIQQFLGKEAIEFADAMVGYLSNEMAAIGNEVSMELYGYRKFTEKYYFPYESSRDFLNQDLTKENFEMADASGALKGWGAAKKLTTKANNPIVIHDFFETWANHVNKMCIYGAFTVATDNMNRIYNYKTPVDSDMTATSIKEEMNRAFGTGAAKYMATLVRDIAGGMRAQDRTKMGKMISRFKKGATAANLQVVVQQPSSIARVMIVMNPRYLMGAVATKKNIEEMRKHSGIATIKEMGRFDTGTGLSATQWLTENIRDEKLMDRAVGKMDKATGYMAEKGDLLTWGTIWHAVKREINHTMPELQIGSEEYFKAVAKRFNDVIDLTQVYDSTLSKSELMRSNSAFDKMATSFMSEPTVTYNMLQDAIVHAKDMGGKKKLLRATSVWVSAALFNAMLKSLISAMRRKDDEERTYIEKYLAEVWGNFSGDMNPAGMIPIARDIVSLFEGYDVNRADMEIYAQMVDAIETLENENKSFYDKVKAITGATGNMLGIPAGNVWRDAEGILNIFRSAPIGETSFRDIKYSVLDETAPILGKFDIYDESAKGYYGRITDAMESGNEEKAEELRGYMQETEGKSESTVNKGIKEQIKTRLIRGEMDEATAMELLEELGMDADDAYFQVEEWMETARSGNPDYSYSKYNDFDVAVRTGIGLNAAIKELTSHGSDKSDLAGRITSQNKAEYIRLYKTNKVAFANLQERLLTAYGMLGYSREQKLKDMQKWLK